MYTIYIAELFLPKCLLKSSFHMSYGFSNRMEVLSNIVNAILFLKDKLLLIIWIWSVRKGTIAWTFIFSLTRNKYMHSNNYPSQILKMINHWVTESLTTAQCFPAKMVCCKPYRIIKWQQILKHAQCLTLYRLHLNSSWWESTNLETHLREVV